MSAETGKMSRKDFLKTAAAGIGIAAGTLAGARKGKASVQRRLAMVIDLRRCIGCRACTVACKKEMEKPLGVFNSAVKQIDGPGKFPKMRKYFLPILCNHCDNPPCVEECPKTGKATYKRADGVVGYNPKECIGCHACVEACPYGARHIDPTVEAGARDRENREGIGKCEFCRHRIDSDVVPSCVNTCQAKARIFGDLNDPKSPVSEALKGVKGARILESAGTSPQVIYIDPNGVVKMANYRKEQYLDQVI